ncbi:MAG TPA: bifunctional 5,6,7,8-tetrahydromethanopterin hydro-lyase/3-hexulose-6-phosphate synthase [Methanocorpusculum sp.]|jgi:bifunctional enzyme Fae/Hps|nr:bifunctional 5,6,7,8-tetrahydromethanopterin hydro-lyase/3-hexulose-6-phosphate synthase [Methanocorpusculum parvum]MBQ1179294.1 bifunctional 5,6,7,8-tetrahydromethanopterin hydro-lyase/3-hexulose-6-phosphate synthase [Methanocorpusculum sp.]MBQ2772468.1 bifunctional 5,6,7,8-tetrahydromethanopterin hydro-lyase/3-hexulose-6-phosphate synthase [Methanocorpusculum sp.]MBQ4134163.1 bifunctional 5,6,7,8-tetrahydromethanopterin hydro-lyase/3-hexulose-6-phosphate synthase [Methanocorpusculum sp.]MB
MFLIGEALVGDGAELAHIDLMIGDKNGPVGSAFANGLTQLSAGHTPLLGVIRPNLLPKPAVLIVPKVTLKHGEQVTQIFGPAQAAVSKAIADALEDGVFDGIDIEENVIVASVFIDPSAKDFNKLYRFNYGATRLALSRALDKFPDAATVLKEKDRAAHGVMGFKVHRLWNPPYLQVAMDLVDMRQVERVLTSVPQNDHVIFEAGTPLIKQFGLSVIGEIRKIRPNCFIVADLKTLDTGNLEARMVSNAGGDAAVVSGLAPIETIAAFIKEAKKCGIYAIIDMLNVEEPAKLIEKLGEMGGKALLPQYVEMHRAIDKEASGEYSWGDILKIKEVGQKYGAKILVATAGGIRQPVVKKAIAAGADIVVVGRAITASKDIKNAAESFLAELDSEEIDQFRVMTDF